MTSLAGYNKSLKIILRSYVRSVAEITSYRTKENRRAYRILIRNL
jgi:hypothetical protein